MVISPVTGRVIVGIETLLITDIIMKMNATSDNTMTVHLIIGVVVEVVTMIVVDIMEGTMVAAIMIVVVVGIEKVTTTVHIITIDRIAIIGLMNMMIVIIVIQEMIT